MPCHTLPHLALTCLALQNLTSTCLPVPYLALTCRTLHHLALPCLTSTCLALQYLTSLALPYFPYLTYPASPALRYPVSPCLVLTLSQKAFLYLYSFGLVGTGGATRPLNPDVCQSCPARCSVRDLRAACNPAGVTASSDGSETLATMLVVVMMGRMRVGTRSIGPCPLVPARAILVRRSLKGAQANVRRRQVTLKPLLAQNEFIKIMIIVRVR